LPDDTIASAMEASGEEVDAESLARLGNVATKLLGLTPRAEVSLRTERLEPGDRYLLCTDGLWGSLGVAELQAALARDASLERSATALVDGVAKRTPPRPHTTAIVIDVAAT
jgi:serine/threonine protein phosphatase PrpC